MQSRIARLLVACVAALLLWKTTARSESRPQAASARARLESLLDTREPVETDPRVEARRGDRAARILATTGKGADASEAACWFIERFAAEHEPRDLHPAAGAALLALQERMEAA